MSATAPFENALNDRQATIVDCAVLRQVLLYFEMYAEGNPDTEQGDPAQMLRLGCEAIGKLEARAKDFRGITEDATALIARLRTEVAP
jgi:hypothetical protein